MRGSLASPRFICPLDHTCWSDAVWATSTDCRGVGSCGGGGDDRYVQGSGSCRGGTTWTSGSRGPVGAEPRLIGQALLPLLDARYLVRRDRSAHPRLGAHPGQHVPASTPHRSGAGAPSRRVAPRPVVRPKSAIAGRWAGKSSSPHSCPRRRVCWGAQVPQGLLPLEVGPESPGRRPILSRGGPCKTCSPPGIFSSPGGHLSY